MIKQLTKARLGLGGLLVALFPLTVYAKESVPDNLYTTYAMTYAEGKERLSQFTSKVWFGNDWLGMSSEMLYLINSFVQAVFWVTKMIFYVCSGIYEFLSDLSVFDYYVVTALTKAADIFTGLKNQFLPAIGISMAVYIGYVYFVKNGSFAKTLLRLFVTFACASILFGQYNGKYAIKHIYDGMTVVTDEVVEKTFKGLTFGKDKLSDKAFSGDGQSVVLDKYFDIAIFQPYKYLNGDVTATDGGKPSFFFTDQEYIDLLDYISGDDSFKIDSILIGDIVGTEKEPLNRMMKSSWGAKFTYAFASLIDVFVLGVILDIFAVTAFAMRLMIVLLIILGAFVAVIAMFPTMDNVLLNFIKTMGMNLAVSGLMSFFALLVLWLYDVLSEILNSLLVGQPFLIAVVKLAILGYLYKKRDVIVAILTANRVSHLSNRLTNRLSGVGSRFGTRVQDNALSKLRLASTAGKETVSGAFKIGARKTGQGTRRLLNRFNPAVEPDVNHIRDVERRDGQYDLRTSQREGRQRTSVESVKDFGRNLSSFKHKVQGTVKKVRAEGVKDKDSQAYKDLRTEAEQHLNISQAKKTKALGYRQRAYNQETKERLMKQRSERSRIRLNPTKKPTSVYQEPNSQSFRSSEDREHAPKLKVSRVSKRQTVSRQAIDPILPKQERAIEPQLRKETGDFNQPYITEEHKGLKNKSVMSKPNQTDKSIVSHQYHIKGRSNRRK